MVANPHAPAALVWRPTAGPYRRRPSAHMLPVDALHLLAYAIDILRGNK